MPEQLKVISTPEQKKQITVGNNVPKIVWAFDVQKATANGDAGKLSVELLLDPGVPAPGEGSTVQGDLEQTAYGWRLRLPRPGGGGGGGGGRFGKTSPDERRSIERQTSVKVAAASLFVIDRNASKEDVADWGKKLRWLTDEVHAAIRGES